MSPETLTALQASIAKWERNADAVADDAFSASVSWKTCPLCILFFGDNCAGCPVFDKTGAPKCDLSPYGQAADALADWRFGGWASDDGPSEGMDKFHAAARAEVDFLKSLLPENAP